MKATLSIITLNILTFIFFFILNFYNSDFVLKFIAWNYSSDFFNPLQLITYQFIHVDGLHLLFNVLLFSFCAFEVEEKLGWKKMVLFYLICGITAGISHIIFSKLPVAGASGSIWGLLMIYSYLFPERTFESLFTKIPIRIFVRILFVTEIFFLITGLDEGVSNIAHVVGGITGLLLIVLNENLKKSKSKTLN
jgi:membrane associated rhomboid family serine protease